MLATWVVRPASWDDAPLLAEVAAGTFPLACPDDVSIQDIDLHIRQRLSVDAFLITLADVEQECIVAVESPGHAAGYALITIPGRAGELAELRQLYVRAELHGSGVADALMDVAKRRTAESGSLGLRLGTSRLNARAIAFYRRHDFRITGQRVFLVGETACQDWVMQWDRVADGR